MSIFFTLMLIESTSFLQPGKNKFSAVKSDTLKIYKNLYYSKMQGMGPVW